MGADLVDAFDEVLVAVVDDGVGAEFAAELAFRSDPTVTAIFTPRWFAIWIAAVPIPDPPPWTSSHSPASIRPRPTMFDHTVDSTSGRAAASVRSKPSGTGSS